MNRPALVVLLAMALFGCALALVTSQHRARSLFVDVERAQQQARQLDIDYDRLKIELARLSQPAYVESQARRLGMKPVDASRTVYLNLPEASAAAALPPGPRK